MSWCSLLLWLAQVVYAVVPPSRMFRQVTTNRSFSEVKIGAEIGGPIVLPECAARCGASAMCLAFTFTTKPNKCQLLRTKAPVTWFYHQNTALNYYEEDCTRFQPKNLCLFDGIPNIAVNESCKYTGTCKCHNRRGNICEKNCISVHRVGITISSSYNIGTYNVTDVGTCVDNCTEMNNCHSFEFIGPTKQCVMKSESAFTLTEAELIITTPDISLYSMQCKLTSAVEQLQSNSGLSAVGN